MSGRLFVVDENLGQPLAAGMAAFGEDVNHLRDLFPQGTKDPQWLAELGDAGHLLITRDVQIKSRPLEIEALRKHRVGAFFLGGKNRSRCELIQQLVRSWPEIKRLAGETGAPFGFRVRPQGGRLERLF